jgi:hypothetical protein
VTERAFSLRSFPATAPAPELCIDGAAALRSDVLELRYVVRGALADVVFPPPVAQPLRRHGLWQTTCFELFLAPRGSERYWEFNVSPSGDWNAYRFTGYRCRMQEERAFSSLPCLLESRSDVLSLQFCLDLRAILPEIPELEAGVAATLLHQERPMTFWALAHPGAEPDFHRRDAFLLPLSRGQA